MNSYQNSYSPVRVIDEQNDPVEEVGNATCRGFFLGCHRRSIKIGGVALVLLAAFLACQLNSSGQQRLASFAKLSCSRSSPLVVDDTGIMENAPGSDGVCNDPVHWFHDQLVDHFADSSIVETSQNKWTQKYFINDDYYRGPGHPIFFIMGGEDQADCLFYPFVTHNLARMFGGLTLEAEHRFYGQSQPIDPLENVRDMIGILTPDQALEDFLRLLKFVQKKYGCSTDRTSSNYCPVVTVGASYPGFLSAMMRFVYPNIVDMAYASSAPLPLYAQEVDPNAYFDKVTQSAEIASAGCPRAVKSTLIEIEKDLEDDEESDDVRGISKRLGICTEGEQLPAYIKTKAILFEEFLFTVAANFADFNMENYPPRPTNDLNRACHAIQNNQHLSAYDRIQAFWDVLQTSEHAEASEKGACFDLRTQIPGGPRGTVTSADWTGGGDGKTGLSWDFQTCKDLVVQAGYGPKSMFPERPWTYKALTDHCQYRFGLDPTPTRLVDKWHFDDLVAHNASRILFTNGLNDGWSVDSILESLSPDLVVINIPNGAHRSDLKATTADTDEVRNSYPLIIQTLTRWLTEVKLRMHQADCE